MAKENKTRWHKFKAVLSDFADNTTCHGIGSINRSDHILVKLCWSLIVIGAVCMMVRQMRLIFIKYRSYPKSTIIEVGNDNFLDFPSVTVCNLNSIRYSLLQNSALKKFEKLQKFVDKDIKPKIEKQKEQMKKTKVKVGSHKPMVFKSYHYF
jgi:hypothetical protein